jgi:polyisoprenoid-binding protein YceI
MGNIKSLSSNNRGNVYFASAVFALLLAIAASAQQSDFKLDPAKTTVKFSLDAALHGIHGAFRVKPGVLHFDRGTGRLSGEVQVDAKSGETGNGMRDRKMHREILESELYPDIDFDPDRISGAVAQPGRSSVMVHGIFRIHGVNREITVPVVVEVTGDYWSSTVHLTIPYEKWGIKNPSTLFLRVSDSVEIDLTLAGSVAGHNTAALQ